MKTKTYITRKGNIRYASKRRQDIRKARSVRSVNGDWADWHPRRDVGVFANYRSTYRHNGETHWA